MARHLRDNASNHMAHIDCGRSLVDTKSSQFKAVAATAVAIGQRPVAVMRHKDFGGPLKPKPRFCHPTRQTPGTILS